MNRFILLLGLIILVFLASLSLAEIPKLINYQGMLTDAGGTPIDGARNLTFRIYDDTTGAGTLQWIEVHNGVQVDNGLFNVILGTDSTLDLAFDKSYWLEVEVEGEVMPRIRFTSVGYAYRASIADSAVVAGSGSGEGGGWADDGAVVRLETAGDSVGIGTTSPAAKLDVSGDININSVYKIEGETVLYVDSDQNTFVGQEAGAANAGGYFNTFIGNSAGHENQDGARNTFLGKNAGYYHRSGVNNTFLGYYAGYNHRGSAGDDDNVFVGHHAGYSDTSGLRNTFFGAYGGYSNVVGYDNTFVGIRAGYSTQSNRNTFVGCNAGQYNISGYGNTFIGGFSGWHNESGGSNTYVGYCAGYNGGGAYSSSNNTYLGFFAGQNSQDGDSNVFIGHMAGSNETGSNKLIIANGPDTADVIIYGDFSTGEVGIGTLSPTEKLDVNGTLRLRDLEGVGGEQVYVNEDGVLVRGTPSSRRYKKNIRELRIDPDKVLKLQTVRFEWKASGEEDIGLIAEDAQQLVPDLIRYDKEGKPDGVKYERLSLYLLEAMKELKEENNELKRRIEALEEK